MTTPATQRMVPTLHGPIPSTPESYQFNTMRRCLVPVDPDDYGYVEEEYFVSGRAAIYADDLTVTGEVPYTNRLIVRRPADLARASGVVYLEILNASNGYDAEGLWRRAWNYWMPNGDVYVGISSKPITIDSLKIFDPVRYAPLSWELDPSVPREPVRPVPGEPFDAVGMVIEAAEEGLVWDIVTQTGRLLRDPSGAPILGGLDPRVLVLAGQSQSGLMLNTWIRYFHASTRGADGRPLFDAYLNSLSSILERPLRQATSQAGFVTIAPTEAPPVDIPMITITCEGDLALWAGLGHSFLAQPGLADGTWRRHYCVPGAPHSETYTPVIPAPEEVEKAGRQARRMTPEAIAVGNPFPLEAAVTAAMDALVAWADQTAPPPVSTFFTVDADGKPRHDDYGNVRGDLRYGIIEHPVAIFVGSPTGGTLGSITLLPRDELLERFPTLQDYLDAVAFVDDRLVEQGYLNEVGYRTMQTVAADLYERATVESNSVTSTWVD